MAVAALLVAQVGTGCGRRTEAPPAPARAQKERLPLGFGAYATALGESFLGARVGIFWRNYEHRVKALVDGQLVPVPINLDTVNRVYGLSLTSEELPAFFARMAEPRYSMTWPVPPNV